MTADHNAERPAGTPEIDAPPPDEVEQCPVCGSEDLADIRCKVICRNCRTIVKSCSDL
jgi:hypothetical protein